MRRRRQHLLGHPIRFLFVDIARLVNLEFGLQTQSLLFAALAALATRHRVIAAGALTLEELTGGGHRGWFP
jgi:xanthine dehydrogenase molybdopterin-binding subunit B